MLIPLRDADESPMRISQGQYGNRQATPRIRKLLEHEAIPATFFYPAVSALLHPEEVRAIADDGHEIGIHSWIHEANTTLSREAERDLTFRAAATLARIAGRDPVGMRTASWDFSVNTLDIVPRSRRSRARSRWRLVCLKFRLNRFSLRVAILLFASLLTPLLHAQGRAVLRDQVGNSEATGSLLRVSATRLRSGQDAPLSGALFLPRTGRQ